MVHKFKFQNKLINIINISKKMEENIFSLNNNIYSNNNNILLEIINDLN